MHSAGWPAEVESTGYFVVAEALANAVKHAAGATVSRSTWRSEPTGDCEIIVTDDGSGPASG